MEGKSLIKKIKNYNLIEKCRISGNKDLIKILDLGNQPLANSLKTDQSEVKQKYPLSISYGKESSLIQLNETVNKEILFDHYVWVTGTAKATKKYSSIFCDRVILNTEANKDDLIIEIASNDGTFLKPFLKKGFKNILGIDPAKNIAEIANKDGVKTLPKFWQSDLAEKINNEKGSAKIIFARNVIPHVSELLDVIKGIQIGLSNSGSGIIEFHYSGKILDDLQYDSIYHEHLCYFSIKSMTYLLNQFSLHPYHVETSPISGGARVIYFSKTIKKKSFELEQAIEIEKNKKINELSTWQNFANKVTIHRQNTLDILNSLKGKKILGFGSSARSQTYLNFCEVDNNQITAIVDNNPLKVGLFAPGSSIPIVNLLDGLKLKPDIIFILAWNFLDEIVAECSSKGYRGKFLIPFPNKPFIQKNK